MTLRLENKIALITGGGAGIGKAIATRFAEEGADVCITDINIDSANAVAASINANGGKAHAVHQDVTQEHTWGDILTQLTTEKGQLDILVNNAGIVIPSNVEDTTLEDWRKTQAVNLDAVFLGTRAAIKHMKANGGSIINISSIEGIVGEPTAAAYNASKGGVRIFTKSAALHCAAEGYGIRINSVHPGFIWTDMVEQAFETMDKDIAEPALLRINSSIPFGKMGQPIDIANGCLFLASDESTYMTGSELIIDGGYTAH